MELSGDPCGTPFSIFPTVFVHLFGFGLKFMYFFAFIKFLLKFFSVSKHVTSVCFFFFYCLSDFYFYLYFIYCVSVGCKSYQIFVQIFFNHQFILLVIIFSNSLPKHGVLLINLYELVFVVIFLGLWVGLIIVFFILVDIHLFPSMHYFSLSFLLFCNIIWAIYFPIFIAYNSGNAISLFISPSL